jgi:hypothetical protein
MYFQHFHLFALYGLYFSKANCYKAFLKKKVSIKNFKLHEINCLNIEFIQ